MQDVNESDLKCKKEQVHFSYLWELPAASETVGDMVCEIVDETRPACTYKTLDCRPREKPEPVTITQPQTEGAPSA